MAHWMQWCDQNRPQNDVWFLYGTDTRNWIWPVSIFVIAKCNIFIHWLVPTSEYILAGYIGRLVPRCCKVKESAWFTLFTHVLNCHGIPCWLCTYVYIHRWQTEFHVDCVHMCTYTDDRRITNLPQCASWHAVHASFILHCSVFWWLGSSR